MVVEITAAAVGVSVVVVVVVVVLLLLLSPRGLTLTWRGCYI